MLTQKFASVRQKSKQETIKHHQTMQEIQEVIFM